jgi:hypothetical protein
MMKTLVAALLCLAAMQEAQDDISRTIEQLSDEDPQVCASAEATLTKLGLKAFPALYEASKSASSRKRQTLRRIMTKVDRIEFEKIHDAETRKELENPSTDGAFRKSYPLAVEGGGCKAAVYEDKGGLAISTEFSSHPAWFTFDIVNVKDSAEKPLEVKRCGECSPGWAHVMNPGPVRVKYSVTRIWYSEYELEFESPKNGDQRRVGDFVITVKWPDLELTSHRPFAETNLKSNALAFWFDHKDPDRTPHITGGGRYGGRFANRPRHTTWCMCKEGPKPVEKRPAERVTSRRIKYALKDGEGVVIPDNVEDVALIRWTFSKPIEERFELESPELLPSKVLGER